MRVRDCNWFRLEEYLRGDDRIVLPLGSTEQHGYLSLETDNILAERVAAEAAEPLGVPVLPALPYGLTPTFAAYPGSPTLRLRTFAAVVSDLLDSLHGQGFRRILIVNGHGGNTPAESVRREWASAHGDAQVRFHNWWIGPRVWELVQGLDPGASHASWMENFPWTRLPGVELPSERKEPLSQPLPADPRAMREAAGDGQYGGFYQLPDEDVLRVWQTGVEETRELLESGWR
ncbi:MAG TPA: creatininase family protein [Gaiellaceae bacterium]|nr:creatininase family protein [Gaiellaceae bacterium]